MPTLATVTGWQKETNFSTFLCLAVTPSINRKASIERQYSFLLHIASICFVQWTCWNQVCFFFSQTHLFSSLLQRSTTISAFHQTEKLAPHWCPHKGKLFPILFPLSILRTLRKSFVPCKIVSERKKYRINIYIFSTLVQLVHHFVQKQRICNSRNRTSRVTQTRLFLVWFVVMSCLVCVGIKNIIVWKHLWHCWVHIGWALTLACSVVKPPSPVHSQNITSFCTQLFHTELLTCTWTHSWHPVPEKTNSSLHKWEKNNRIGRLGTVWKIVWRHRPGRCCKSELSWGLKYGINLKFKPHIPVLPADTWLSKLLFQLGFPSAEEEECRKVKKTAQKNSQV